MVTASELETRLEALKAQRDSAVARVSYDGRSVEYRGTAEIARAIADLVGLEKFPPALSLSITFGLLAAGVLWSLLKTRGTASAPADNARATP